MTGNNSNDGLRPNPLLVLAEELQGMAFQTPDPMGIQGQARLHRIMEAITGIRRVLTTFKVSPLLENPLYFHDCGEEVDVCLENVRIWKECSQSASLARAEYSDLFPDYDSKTGKTVSGRSGLVEK